MGRAVLRLALFGLLLTLTATLPNKDDWDIYSFHINSTVTSRYATTTITSRVANRMNESKEVEFHVRIPKNAFISKFRMFIDGEVYDGTVRAKEQAQRQYTEAVTRGQSAGIVSSVGRTLEEFKTSVNMAAHKKVTFELTYEELMKRTLGKYELQIHARPMQPVKDFKVDVHIQEKAGISFLEVKGGLSTKALANAITKTYADKQAWVHFYPTEDQQKSCDSCSDEGMNGDLVIVYDVNRDTEMGDIMKSAGYFVHHFAPSKLTRIPKNFVFVIDQSGSMHGKKMLQTRIALIHILNDLVENDHFGLITFDDSIHHWKRELVQANSANLESAKAFARQIRDRGATDINAAVLEGTRMLNAHPREGSASILILLTDGDPTSGETNIERIQSNVRRAIKDKFPLYCLGFGFDVNFEFLEKMSLQNNGVARRIYEDSDADLQLKGFYEEVATPLLIDVTMTYIGGTNLTQTNFSQYYNGSEIVVAGQITDNNIETFTPQVVAISESRSVTFYESADSAAPAETVSNEQLQRVWAFLTVKQLLQKELQLSGSEKEEVKKETLELSLKYNFVTPLTSMVVTKPPGEKTDVLHKPKEGKGQQSGPWGGVGGSFVPRTGSYGMRPMGPPSGAGMGRGGGGRGMAFSPPSFHPIGHRRGGASNHLTGLEQKIKVSAFAPAVLDAEYEMEEDQYFMVHHPTGSILDLLEPSYAPTFSSAHEETAAPTAQPTTPEIILHRFLLKMEDLSLPLCFDIVGLNFIKLLHHPSRELSVNGELDSETSGGFKQIVIRFGTDNHIKVDTEGVSVQAGVNARRLTETDMFSDGSMTVIKTSQAVDVAVGDVRMMIYIHQKAGKKFLWPILRQKSSDTNTGGILAVMPAVYEKIQENPSVKLRMKDQEIDVTSTSAVDYSINPPMTMSCWLMSAELALQRPLTDVFVSQL